MPWATAGVGKSPGAAPASTATGLQKVIGGPREGWPMPNGRAGPLLLPMPPIVSGTAKMRHGQFVLWNLHCLAGLLRSRLWASTYGLGRLFHRALRRSTTSGRWWWDSSSACWSPWYSCAADNGLHGMMRRADRIRPERRTSVAQRGRPRMRPAMMSRWISDVPPAMLGPAPEPLPCPGPGRGGGVPSDHEQRRLARCWVMAVHVSLTQLDSGPGSSPRPRRVRVRRLCSRSTPRSR